MGQLSRTYILTRGIGILFILGVMVGVAQIDAIPTDLKYNLYAEGVGITIVVLVVDAINSRLVKDQQKAKQKKIAHEVAIEIVEKVEEVRHWIQRMYSSQEPNPADFGDFRNLHNSLVNYAVYHGEHQMQHMRAPKYRYFFRKKQEVIDTIRLSCLLLRFNDNFSLAATLGETLLHLERLDGSFYQRELEQKHKRSYKHPLYDKDLKEYVHDQHFLIELRAGVKVEQRGIDPKVASTIGQAKTFYQSFNAYLQQTNQVLTLALDVLRPLLATRGATQPGGPA